MSEPDEPTRVERLRSARAALEALLLSEEDGSKAASLSREIRAIDDKLDLLAPAKRRSTIDELARKRSDRIAEAQDSDAPAVRKRGGRRGGDSTS